MRRELKQRLSESRAKRWSSESRSKLVCILPSRDRVRGTQIVWALPNRWSSESHQACLNGRVVTEVGEANVSCFDRRSNITNGAKRMADFLAFGEFGRRLSHLGKFNTCQWHSACTKSAFGEPTHARPIASELAWRSLNRGLGHSNIFATLSLSGAHLQ